MFQSFEITSEKTHGPERVAQLRQKMAELDIDAFIVPHTDEYQNEYLPERAERLAWLTGFTGSAGYAVILADQAVVYTDGRYKLQVKDQTVDTVFETRDSMNVEGTYDIKNWGKKGLKIGIDPWLHTMATAAQLSKESENLGIELIYLESNPVDAIWNGQPDPPQGKVSIHEQQFAGVLAKTKLNEIGKAVREKGADVTILTDATSICWTFNIRGHDVVHTPLALAFAIVPAKGNAKLFIDPEKLDMKEQAYLNQLCDLEVPEDFIMNLEQLGKNDTKVLLDPSLVSVKLANTLEQAGAEIVKGADPCRLPRARKNKTERKGAIEAHKRDGAAMVSFLAWLDGQQPGDLDEIEIATALEIARIKTGERLGVPLREISFDTISGAGPNGAVVHYRVNRQSNRRVNDGDLLLVDSGGQYDDGTTDITRVIPVGEPTDEHRRHFTLVLKGMIAISLAKFPAGTRGVDLDVLARKALWAEGLDYAHGTGHGVGSYLGVHEGPQNISRRSMTPFETGMIVSNEPGYYKEGSHGIRIENLVIVDPPKIPEGGELEMHGFTTLTLCPIDRRLIDVTLLSTEEKRWVNAYHSKVRNELSKLIDDEDTLRWLEKATRRIKRV